MKKLFPFFVLLMAFSLTGCAWFHHQHAPKVATPNIVTPDASLAAKVISINPVGRFVVLNFPSGDMPKLQQTLFLYRAGLKTAEVKVTGPQSESNIVADLVSGEVQVGDTVRDQ
jgi:hypothetical protein